MHRFNIRTRPSRGKSSWTSVHLLLSSSRCSLLHLKSGTTAVTQANKWQVSRAAARSTHVHQHWPLCTQSRFRGGGAAAALQIRAECHRVILRAAAEGKSGPLILQNLIDFCVSGLLSGAIHMIAAVNAWTQSHNKTSGQSAVSLTVSLLRLAATAFCLRV